ncbi:UNVERIFIED_CONTAM: hypothetical protein FKN15_019966 [Acipenser sinensis]
MLLKHVVDKHNLYFAYLPAKLDRKIHYGAVNQALAAPIMCLFWLYFFSVLRTGFTAITSLFTLIVLCITICICLTYTCFGHFKYLSPHNYKVKENVDEIDSVAAGIFESAMYVPKVLQTPQNESTPLDHKVQQSYGTVEDNIQTADDSDKIYLVEDYVQACLHCILQQ